MRTYIAITCIHPHEHISMEQQAFLYLLPLLTFFLLLLIVPKLNKAERKKKLPPGPWRLPILGNLHLLDPNKLHRSLLSLSNKYGPLILLHLGPIPTLLVSSRSAAENIFTNHDYVFCNRPPLTATNKLLYSNAGISFAPYADQWRQARKISMVELLSARRVRSFKAIRAEEVGKLVAAIGDLSAVDLSELSLLLVNNIVCRAALGDEFGDAGYGGKAGEWLRRVLSETQSLIGGLCAADYFPWMGWVDRLRGFHERLEKNFEEMDEFLDRVIQKHLRKEEEEEEEEGYNGNKDGGEEEQDLLHVLLRLHKLAGVHGGSGFLSKIDHVKAVLVETFVAGTDTSSATITWTMTELMRNPRVMHKLQAELKQATNGLSAHRLIQEGELEKLPYLKQVIKESPRIRPPVPLLLPRETMQPCEIEGYVIPAKTRVIFNAMAISTDPNVWEKPLEFRPERFDGGKVDFMGQDFELLPFGSGRRRCPGIGFAMVIVELALANLVHCFDWSMSDGTTAEDIDMEEAVGITTHKKEALCLVAKPKW